eukprot:gnl/TRDRNA2_/TRDRNA2_177414_c1_seq1.p1 gnl/TRDRNA2_/TRDRNA2_177414_c1~~gnl/TRDRNA2_/TRDRNA2_177414_c1_seq1.p1  ORF type:complete len:678 (+),score=264.66 gnl/TRDRNA2_/TRDRNA2_177414_c1_seq1:86-2119(+)
MKTSAVILCFALAAFASADVAQMSPIAKVISMIEDLEAKVMKDGEAAQKTYNEFSEFCEERSKELTFEIKTGTANSEELKATIDKASADMTTFTTQIEELSAKIAKAQADLKDASEIRKKEAADFAAEEKELETTIAELTGGITAIEKEMASGASMVQLKGAKTFADALSAMVQASVFSTADGQRLTALVQSLSASDDADEDLAAPAGATYESHSGGIDGLLKGLLEKAETQLDQARQAERKAVSNFEILVVSLKDEIKFGGMDMEHAKKDLAEATETKATAEGDLTVTTKDLAEDTAASNELHNNCMSKANAFEVETKERGEELKALATAKKIIQEATGGAEKIAYGLNQVSFLQLAAPASKGFAAVHFVRRLAQKEHSAVLSQLASRMASAVNYKDSANPFGKIKDLIMGMIEKLEKEAEADAAKKGYCDKELSENNAKKDDNDAEISKLSTKIDSMTAESAKLKEEVTVLQKELAEIASTQVEMDKVRSEEKAEYMTAKAELEQGVAGIKMALKVLREYYAGDASHETSSDAGEGIISMLEIAESDFTKGLQETIATEEASAAAYAQDTKENEVQTATKNQDAKYKAKDAKSLDQSIAEFSSDRSGVQEELDAVNQYLAKLHEECDAKVEPYEERKARRESEISGLKEALSILEGEGVLLQKRIASTTLRGARK